MHWNLRVKLYVTKIQQSYFSILYNTVYLKFSDIAEPQKTDGSLEWLSWGELGNRSMITNYRLPSPNDVIQVFYRHQLKLHGLFHHRQPTESTSSRSNIGSWKSKNGKLASWNTGKMRSQENSDMFCTKNEQGFLHKNHHDDIEVDYLEAEKEVWKTIFCDSKPTCWEISTKPSKHSWAVKNWWYWLLQSFVN